MKIGFIGLGNMGGPMALNLIKKGHTLTVFDVRKAQAEPHLSGGATWADNPAAAARNAEVVFTSLPGPKEIEHVATGEGGLIHGMAKGAIYADLSTGSPTLIRRIHDTFKEKGIPVLDTPVSGGTPGARNATLAVMVGGDEALYNKIKPVLDCIGDKVSYVGPIGAGAVAKLVHNMIAICTTMMLRGAMPRVIFKGGFDKASFALRLARKDLGLATELAREHNVPMPVANLVEQGMIEAIVKGWAEKDSSAAFMVQEERAGVKVRTEN